VSGAHLSDRHNKTWRRIEADGFEIVDRIDSLLSTDRVVQRSKGVGLLIQGLTQTVEREEPDFLLVDGDREECIAAAIIGNYMEKLVIHIGGGDPAYGNADDPIRFAVSKLAHIHCCTAQEYADNLIRIGEEDFRVFRTGNPAYVNIDKVSIIQKDELFLKLGVDMTGSGYIVLIKHPLSSEVEQSYTQMKTTLKGLEVFCHEQNYHTICIPPNSDPGSFEMLKAIEEYSRKEWFHFMETLPRDEFINLIRYGKALLGNSSMGILEAPHYGLPVVNVGNRQKGRLNAGNVQFVDYNLASIVSALEQACLDKKYRDQVIKLKNPFGDGTAARKVREVIESVNLNDRKWYIKERLC
jgi:GDP/UDP-N,N'-diacetylbacillosamine 2-epimerase (hydrolysing)